MAMVERYSISPVTVTVTRVSSPRTRHPVDTRMDSGICLNSIIIATRIHKLVYLSVRVV